MVGTISAGVGRGRANRSQDVEVVEQMLANHARWLFPLSAPTPNGQIDEVTIAAIEAFQRNAVALKTPDGAVDPNGTTMRFLNRSRIEAPKSRVFLPVCWDRPANGLTAADFAAAAQSLGCEVAAIQAVAQVETKRSAWDEDGRPTILFERHYFRKFTGAVYNRSHPDISGAQGGYGKFSEQYSKLRRAAMLDEVAALKSASWGAFQIMGANFKEAGFTSVEDFVDAMVLSEARHLAAFVAFINADSAKKKALKDRDWATFAKRYNGAKYAENNYDTKMAAAYQALKAAAH